MTEAFYKAAGFPDRQIDRQEIDSLLADRTGFTCTQIAIPGVPGGLTERQ